MKVNLVHMSTRSTTVKVEMMDGEIYSGKAPAKLIKTAMSEHNNSHKCEQEIIRLVLKQNGVSLAAKTEKAQRLNRHEIEDLRDKPKPEKRVSLLKQLKL